MPRTAQTVREMVDVLSRDGRVVALDQAQADALGLAADQARGAPWSAIYPLESREQLEDLFARADPGPHVLGLTLRRASGGLLRATAVATPYADPDHGRCLRLVKWPASGALDALPRLAEEKDVLASILAASSDAGWCMEWAEPVDLSAPEQEIVRQVFENGPRWRFCNAAMARLYRAPEDMDFNDRPVGEVFPRTPENEDFVRALVRADFHIDASPARDLRYDGVYIEVENDVRGQIRGNRLLRMWGTVRDVSKQARRAALLREEIERLEAILDALPDAALLIDATGKILWSNDMAQSLLDAALARAPAPADPPRLTDLVELPHGPAALFEAAEPGRPARLPALPLRPAGRIDLAARRLELRETQCLALTLRPRLGLAPASGRPATPAAPAGA